MNPPFADALLYGYVSRKSGRQVPLFEPGKLASMRSVLLMLTTGLGDAVLSSPVFPAIRAAMPLAKIRLFCRASWVPLFRSDPNLDSVIPYLGKYRRFFPTVATLRSFSPDLAVVLHGNDPDIIPLAYLAGSRYVIRVPTRGTRYEFLLANRDRAQDESTAPGLHYVDNRLRILDTLGIPAVSHTPRIHLDQQAVAAVKGKLAVLLKGAPYWVLHANAADAYKGWPPERLRELLVMARKQFGRHAVFLTGATGESGSLRALAAGIEGVHVVAGEFDVAGTAAILAGAECVVAPDTGILHLAAALDRPVIGLYAPTFSALVGPRSGNAIPIVIQKPRTCDPCVEKQCPFTPRNCMDQITSEEVFTALRKQLGDA
jgi:ADP-heptose:LPS heptosyltransferase